MKAKEIKRIVREYLSKKTPDGYYVIPAHRDALKVLENLEGSLSIEEVGDMIVVKTKSRKIGEEVIRKLLTRNLLKRY